MKELQIRQATAESKEALGVLKGDAFPVVLADDAWPSVDFVDSSVSTVSIVLYFATCAI